MRHLTPSTMNDLTVVYYTSSMLDDCNPFFAANVRKTLQHAIAGTALVSVTQKPLCFGENICVGEIGRSNLNLYQQVLIGVKAAKTTYVAMAEDDVLYTPDHFVGRPRTESILLYNMNRWGVFTWSKSMIYSWRRRVTLSALICNRNLLIECIEERLAKYPLYDNKFCGEPGRYENELGVTHYEIEVWLSAEPIVMFSHPYALGYVLQGKRKDHGTVRAFELVPWGSANRVMELYNEPL